MRKSKLRKIKAKGTAEVSEACFKEPLGFCGGEPGPDARMRRHLGGRSQTHAHFIQRSSTLISFKYKMLLEEKFSLLKSENHRKVKK